MSKFIVSVRCREMKAYDGSVLTEDNALCWLGISEGYAQLTQSRRGAEQFSSHEEITKTASQWDGMPWYYRMKPGTLEIHDITDDLDFMTKSELKAEIARLHAASRTARAA